MLAPFRHPLATHPATEVLGHRRDGRPIYPIAGGSGEGGDAPAPNAGDQPPATPPAPAPEPTPQQPNPAPAPQEPTTPEPAAVQEPQEPAPEPAPDRVESLPKWAQERIRTADAAAHSALVRLALYETADQHGANPAALADSLSFQAAVESLDPNDRNGIIAAAQAAAERNPALKAAPTVPARGAAEFHGAPQPPTSPAATAEPGLPRMRAAYATSAAS